MTLGQAIRHVRRSRDMTQAELADKVGVLRESISQWESDRYYPRADFLPELARALGTTASSLFLLVESKRAA